MKFTHDHNFPDGTHLQGRINITYKQLASVFGEPTSELGDNGDKVRMEWCLKFEDGTIATIYDWKEYRPIEEVTDWHIGGHNIRAFAYIQEALGWVVEMEKPTPKIGL